MAISLNIVNIIVVKVYINHVLQCGVIIQKNRIVFSVNGGISEREINKINSEAIILGKRPIEHFLFPMLFTQYYFNKSKN